jgi:hypothetical protein
MRAGRFDEAWASYRGRDPGSFQAEDFAALGTVLLGRDRLVLGWTALEAARRIEPRHAATAGALEELESRLARARGREQGRLHEAADEVELLRSVRGGPPLGMLVLGLTLYAGEPGGEAEFLDRLLIRDRAALRVVGTTAEAAKLVARLLMETGRPAEAADLLGPLADRSDGAGPPDREAAWLLSRAALQLDQDETADALLERAAGFGREPNPSPEPAPFVGSRRCAECHRATYLAQQLDSPHARTIARGAGLKDIPLPARPVPDPVAPGVTHSLTRRGDDLIEVETRVDNQVVRALVEYAVGSGRHGITMVAKDEPLGVDRELRISYFSTDGTWGATKGINFRPHDPVDYAGLGLSPKALRQCLHCHTTWFRAADPRPAAPRGPEARDRGIGCERCHGPGLNHIKAVASGFAELAIAQTTSSPPRQLLRSCNECHASNGSVEPNDPEFTRVQGTTLMFSRCFTASQGRIHCATCHDPHRGLDTIATHYEAKCLACHASTPSPPRPGPAAPAAPPVPVAARPGRPGAPPCPVNPAAGCIACHMPRVQDPSLRTRFTDHHIRIHRRPGTG